MDAITTECEVCGNPCELPTEVGGVHMCSRCDTLFLQAHVGMLEALYKTPADWLRFQRDTLPKNPEVWALMLRYYGAAAVLISGNPENLEHVRERYDMAICLAETIDLEAVQS